MRQWTHEVYAGKKSLGDVDVLGKRVFLRVDYNVPMKDGVITDDTKIRRSLGTIRFLMKRGAAKIVVGTHLGRPEVRGPDDASSDGGVLPLVACLNEHLKESESKDAAGARVPEFVYAPMVDGVVCHRWFMVENLRVLPVEKTGADGPSKVLFDGFIRHNCDIMVSDGFGVLHRKDYSVVGVKLEKISGLLVDSEMQALSLLLGKMRPIEEKTPTRMVEEKEAERFIKQARGFSGFRVHRRNPIDLIIIGGCKLEDKIGLVKNLLKVGSNVFLGGLLGAPFCAKPYTQEVLEIVGESLQMGTGVLLPKDYVMADLSVVSAEALTPETARKVKDIGPATESLLCDTMKQCARVFWNGALGQAEIPEFSHGTEAVLQAVSKRKKEIQKEDSMLCAGGGDTAGYIYTHEYADAFDFVFTGGGATLEALEGKILPGILALSNNE